jgi:hypothetical protein
VDYTIEIDDKLVAAIGLDFVRDVLQAKEQEVFVLLTKQADYGPNNIALCPVGPENGLIVRLYDKIARLAHITSRDEPPKHEPLADTALDIANYGTILTLVTNGVWPNLPQD